MSHKVVSGMGYLDKSLGFAHKRNPKSRNTTICDKPIKTLVYTKILGLTPCSICYNIKARPIVIEKFSKHID